VRAIVIIGSVAILLLIAAGALSQTPAVIWGSIYNAVLLTLTSPQTVAWQGFNNGYLRVNGLTVGPAQFLLQAPATGNILQTNAVAKICLAGTC
jgi:hypothetical protein